MLLLLLLLPRLRLRRELIRRLRRRSLLLLPVRRRLRCRLLCEGVVRGGAVDLLMRLPRRRDVLRLAL